MLIKIDYGLVGKLGVGDKLEPLPMDRKYQPCFLKNVYGTAMEQLYMLLDENFIVLLRAESKNPVTSRGTVHTKIKYKQIVDSI